MPVADITKRVRYYVSNNGAGTLQLIDGSTNGTIRTYTIGVGAKEVVMSKEGIAYVASVQNQKVIAICLDESTKEFSTPSINGSLDVDSVASKMYVSTGSKINVYNLSNGALLNSISGFNNAVYVKLNESRNRLYVLDQGESQVKIYETSNLNLVGSIPVGAGATYIVINNDSTKGYVSNTQDNTISVLDLVNRVSIATIAMPAGSSPSGLALRNGVLYVANNAADNITLISDFSYSIIPPTINTLDPLRLSFTPDGSKLLVTNNTSGSLTMINPSTKTVEGSINLGGNPYDVVAGYVGSDITPGDKIDLTDSYQLDDIKESVCILVDKVFAHCQERECFPNASIQLPTDEELNGLPPGAIGPFTELSSVNFENGIVDKPSLKITPLPERPNFSRVQFNIIVHYKATFAGKVGSITVNRKLPIVQKDVILFIPKSRDEFKFDIILETMSEILTAPSMNENEYSFAVGVFIVIKVIGKVQLLVPAFGYCPAPPQCEDYVPDEPVDICKTFNDFNQTPFPSDFFPKQYEELECEDLL